MLRSLIHAPLIAFGAAAGLTVALCGLALFLFVGFPLLLTLKAMGEANFRRARRDLDRTEKLLAEIETAKEPARPSLLERLGRNLWN